jgi:hypothetical protein
VGLPVCVRSIGAARRFEGGLEERPYGYGGSSPAAWFGIGDLGVMASAVLMAGRRVQVEERERLRAASGMRGGAYVVCSLDSDSAAGVKTQYAFNPAEYLVHECRTTLRRCTASSQSATCKCGREKGSAECGGSERRRRRRLTSGLAGVRSTQTRRR